MFQGKKSKMKYTIIHAGGLSDLPGGKAPVKLGVDDKLREVKNLRIPRADIAKACVQALVSWMHPRDPWAGGNIDRYRIYRMYVIVYMYIKGWMKIYEDSMMNL